MAKAFGSFYKSPHGAFLKSPHGVRGVPNYFYVGYRPAASFTSGRIIKISPATGAIITTSADIGTPWQIDMDANGFLYVATFRPTSGDHTIFKLKQSDLSVVASTGHTSNRTHGMAVHVDGTIVVVYREAGLPQVRKYSSDLSTVIWTGSLPSGSNSFNCCVDAAGNTYATADLGGGNMRAFSPSGATLWTATGASFGRAVMSTDGSTVYVGRDQVLTEFSSGGSMGWTDIPLVLDAACVSAATGDVVGSQRTAGRVRRVTSAGAGVFDATPFSGTCRDAKFDRQDRLWAVGLGSTPTKRIVRLESDGSIAQSFELASGTESMVLATKPQNPHA